MPVKTRTGNKQKIVKRDRDIFCVVILTLHVVHSVKQTLFYLLRHFQQIQHVRFEEYADAFQVYMLWFNFFFGLIFIFLYFKLIIIHYHA